MGLTKSNIFTKEQNNLASMAKVLAHPARIAILQHLIKMKQCVCGDLVNEIGLAQATISQHLKEMKSIGLIKGTIEGSKVCYCIDTNKCSELKNIFNQILTQAECCNDICCS